jgi:hypothetical protein
MKVVIAREEKPLTINMVSHDIVISLYELVFTLFQTTYYFWQPMILTTFYLGQLIL